MQTAPLLARLAQDGPALLGPYSGAGGDRETNHDTDGRPTYAIRARSLTPDGSAAADVRLTGQDAVATVAAVCRQLQYNRFPNLQ
ncbi:hypothetical protein ACWEO8_13045 [Streptomyces albidoflavus]